MKRPIWKFVVTGFAIYLGLLGTISSLINIAATLTVNTQIQMEVKSPLNEEGESQDHKPRDNPIRHLTEDPTWTIALNVITLTVSIFYQVGAMALIMKPRGERVFYVAMAVSVLGMIVKTAPFWGEHSDLLLTVLFALTPGLITDCILAGVVYVGTRYGRNKPNGAIHQEPSTPTSSNFPSSLYRNIPTITGCFAALCIGVLPFWIMGVPGVENNYAQGWNIGFDVIMYYPLAWIIVIGVSWGLKKIMANNSYESLNFGVAVCLSLFFGLAIFRLFQAISMMAT
ncbi:MAG: hypothetical protein ACPGYT_13735 [Nitrospirales bacterium]